MKIGFSPQYIGFVLEQIILLMSWHFPRGKP